MNQPKLEDLARICQVDKATASRALNHKKGVSQKKREDILRVAKDIGFQPNTFASALAGGSKYTILVLFQDFDFLNNEYYSRLYLNLVKHLNHSGYALITSTLADHQYQKFLLNHQVDGVVLLNSTHYEKVLEICQAQNIPLSGIGNGFYHYNDHEDKLPIPVVSINNYHAGKQAAQHLLSLGASQFIFVTAPDILSFQERQKGFIEFLHETHQIQTYTLPQASYNSHLYVQETIKLFKKLPEHSYTTCGIFCANDDIALGVYQYFKETHSTLPCPLLGFDNTFISEYIGKGLSTFEQNIELISQTCVQSLLELITQKDLRFKPTSIKYLSAQIVERDSTLHFSTTLQGTRA